jgi:hypothetical protein
MAKWLREQAELTAASFLGPQRATGTQLDELAALFARYAVQILRVISSSFDGAAEFLASLELPAGVIMPAPAGQLLSAQDAPARRAPW